MTLEMKAHISTGLRELSFDLARPHPISIRLRDGSENPVAWYADYPSITPVRMEGFVGSVAQGGSVNTNDITFNPHGNGTHTECIGHLTEQAHQLDEFMREYIFLAQLITVRPHELLEDVSEHQLAGDRVVLSSSFDGVVINDDVRAVIIRTLPNSDDKQTRVYTGNNPPYVDPESLAWLREKGIEHVLIDLPSVDRESDGGYMKAHRAFWFNGDEARMHATITEMVYVPNSIIDGEYLLNIMVAPFGNDASPSKPVLYPILP